MKKYISIIIFIILCLSVRAQSNKAFDMAFQVGCVNMDGHSEHVAIGGSLSIYGVYADILYKSPEHRRTIEYPNNKSGIWHGETRAITAHIGYQIPLCKYVKVTPLVGYAKTEYGYTDWWSWGVDNNGVYNNFISQYMKDDIDYGGQAVFYIPCANNVSLTISGTYTRYTVYGGIGFSIKFN